MTIKLEWETKQLLVMQYTGVVQGQELLDISLKLSGDPRFDDLRFILSNWANVKKTKVSTKDVKNLAAYVSAMAKTNGNIKNATVVSNTEEGEALATFYEHLTQGISWQVAHFKEEKAARAWLKKPSV